MLDYKVLFLHCWTRFWLSAIQVNQIFLHISMLKNLLEKLSVFLDSLSWYVINSKLADRRGSAMNKPPSGHFSWFQSITSLNQLEIM